jgi:hypothetical protein
VVRSARWPGQWRLIRSVGRGFSTTSLVEKVRGLPGPGIVPRQPVRRPGCNRRRRARGRTRATLDSLPPLFNGPPQCNATSSLTLRGAPQVSESTRARAQTFRGNYGGFDACPLKALRRRGLGADEHRVTVLVVPTDKVVEQMTGGRPRTSTARSKGLTESSGRAAVLTPFHPHQVGPIAAWTPHFRGAVRQGPARCTRSPPYPTSQAGGRFRARPLLPAG